MDKIYRKNLLSVIKPFFYTFIGVFLIGIFTIPFENWEAPQEGDSLLKDTYESILMVINVYFDSLKDLSVTLSSVAGFFDKYDSLSTNRYSLLGVIATIVIALVLILVDASDVSYARGKEVIVNTVVRWQIFTVATWILLLVLGFLTFYLLFADFDAIGFLVTITLCLILSSTLNFCQEKFKNVYNKYYSELRRENNIWRLNPVSTSQGSSWVTIFIILLILSPLICYFIFEVPKAERAEYFSASLAVVFSMFIALSLSLYLWAFVETRDSERYSNFRVRWEILFITLTISVLFYIFILLIVVLGSGNYLYSSPDIANYLFDSSYVLKLFFFGLSLVALFVFLAMGRIPVAEGVYREICLVERSRYHRRSRNGKNHHWLILLLIFSLQIFSSIFPSIVSGRLSFDYTLFAIPVLTNLVLYFILMILLGIMQGKTFRLLVQVFFILIAAPLATDFSNEPWMVSLCLLLNLGSIYLFFATPWETVYKFVNFNSNFLKDLGQKDAPWSF